MRFPWMLVLPAALLIGVAVNAEVELHAEMAQNERLRVADDALLKADQRLKAATGELLLNSPDSSKTAYLEHEVISLTIGASQDDKMIKAQQEEIDMLVAQLRRSNQLSTAKKVDAPHVAG